MTLVAYNPPKDPHLHNMYQADPILERRESHLQIEIFVIDMNDNEPHFDRSSYNVTVPEDTPPGSTIFQVHSLPFFCSLNDRS